MKLTSALCALCAVTVMSTCPTNKPSTSDRSLAEMVKQSGRMGHSTAEGISSKINEQLRANEVTLKECQNFDAEELNELVRSFWCHLSPELQKVYKSRHVDKRALRFQSLEEYEKNWAMEKKIIDGDRTAEQAIKEAKCAEVLMMWTHHVTEDSKAELQQLFKLPTLPTHNETLAAHPTAGSIYTAGLTCVVGHNMTATSTSDHKFPHWPEEVHYYGMGHGAYPFWLGGGGAGGKGAAIEVWWSEKQRSEKFYHSSCSMTEAGYTKNVPCYHLFVGAQPTPQAYLYTHDEDFCCISGPNSRADDDETGVELLAAPQSDFMDTMTVDENWGNITGTFYSGPAKRYLIKLPNTEAVNYFWYITTMDDLPVQQGEGGEGGSGIFVYHEYNTSSFKATTHDPSVFAVPEICKNSTAKCQFP